MLRTKPYLRRLLAQSVLLGLVGFWPPPGLGSSTPTSASGGAGASASRRLPSQSESIVAEGGAGDAGSGGGRIPRSGSFSTPSSGAPHARRTGERSNSTGPHDGPSGSAVPVALAEARRRLALLGVSAQFAEYLTTALPHPAAQVASASVVIDTATLDAIQALSSRLFDARYYFELLERVVNGTLSCDSEFT